jgi:hypothetical protein
LGKYYLSFPGVACHFIDMIGPTVESGAQLRFVAQLIRLQARLESPPLGGLAVLGVRL